MSVDLYVGGDAGTVQGEPQQLGGLRCFTAAIRLKTRLNKLSEVDALLDSGAFSDPPNRRLTPAQALERQLEWEAKARRFCDAPNWQVKALVSYDRLIDETWIGDSKQKKRWSLSAAAKAVDETVGAAEYLSARRDELAPRKIVLAAQGVDALQYVECAEAVLSYAQPDDWFGFGGWCIIGRNKRMLPEFERTISNVLPLIKRAGIDHVHLFGVMWQPALGVLLWEADRYGIEVSTDSSAPVIACTRKDPKKAGLRAAYWRDNVAWWQAALQTLRSSDYYRAPIHTDLIRQMEMI